MDKKYVVKEICGDYAIIVDENQVEINISTFLLPSDIVEGDGLISTIPFQYEIIRWKSEKSCNIMKYPLTLPIANYVM